MRVLSVAAVALLAAISAAAQVPGISQDQQPSSSFRIGRLKYSGGGDWYNDPSAEVNLLQYVRQNTNIPVEPRYEYVDIASDNIFLYPMLFLTGHGNVNFSPSEARRLRAYLESGGFLYIDDDYGLDSAIRREMKKSFPTKSSSSCRFPTPSTTATFTFPTVHRKSMSTTANHPKALGFFIGDRLCVLYTYESNPSDGWADPDVHHDPPEKREAALKFGTNIVVYALGQRNALP